VDPADVAVGVVRVLERGQRVAVGGSVASSAYGEPRATRDLDFAARLGPSRRCVPIESLGPDLAVDAAARMEDLLARAMTQSFL
jgi:hypothetical protein